MSTRSRFFKDTRRRTSYDKYVAQKSIWDKAHDVSKQINDKVSNKRNVFSDNFIDFLQSMRGEINSVQRHEYKNINFYPKNTIIDDIDQFFNRIVNVYLDEELSVDEIYEKIKFESVEMIRRCQKMKTKYSQLYNI